MAKKPGPFDDFKFQHGQVVSFVAGIHYRGVILNRALIETVSGGVARRYVVGCVALGQREAFEIELQGDTPESEVALAASGRWIEAGYRKAAKQLKGKRLFVHKNRK